MSDALQPASSPRRRDHAAERAHARLRDITPSVRRALRHLLACGPLILFPKGGSWFGAQEREGFAPLVAIDIARGLYHARLARFESSLDYHRLLLTDTGRACAEIVSEEGKWM